MADALVVRSTSRSPVRRKVFLAVAGVLSFLLAGGSAASIATIYYADSQLTKVCTGRGCDAYHGGLTHVINDTPGICSKKQCNFLILGSDSRSGLTKKQQAEFGNSQSVQGRRADTIIVVTIDPIRNRTIVLSLPRDLLVNIPGHGQNKINSAFGYKNGADLMVATVEKLTGLQINHYVEVNFAGFEGLVSALGGVHICIDQPMEDRLAGLHLPHAGCYDLKGAQALAFVRARHVEGDAIPDFSRIARQQQFMRVVIQKLLSVSAITRLGSLIKAVKHNLVVDDRLNLYDLQGLTRRLSGLGQRGVLFRVLPAEPVTVGGVDFVQMLPQAKGLLESIREGKKLGSIGLEAPSTKMSPANITVRVYDAGSNGEARKVVNYLSDAGFIVLPIEPAPTGLEKTEIIFREKTSRQRDVVSSYLKIYSFLNSYRRAKDTGADVGIVIGSDFKGIPF